MILGQIEILLPQLENKYGSTPKEFFLGKSLLVKGHAKRVKIELLSKGRRTGKYYYQTKLHNVGMTTSLVLS